MEVISNAVVLKENRNVTIITRSRMKILREHHPLRKGRGTHKLEIKQRRRRILSQGMDEQCLILFNFYHNSVRKVEGLFHFNRGRI